MCQIALFCQLLPPAHKPACKYRARPQVLEYGHNWNLIAETLSIVSSIQVRGPRRNQRPPRRQWRCQRCQRRGQRRQRRGLFCQPDTGSIWLRSPQPPPPPASLCACRCWQLVCSLVANSNSYIKHIYNIYSKPRSPQGVPRRPEWCKARFALLQKTPMPVSGACSCLEQKGQALCVAALPLHMPVNGACLEQR